MKNPFQKLMGLSFLVLFAFACQSLPEESPLVNENSDEVASDLTSSDPNARKSNMLEFGAFLIGTEEVPPISSPGSGAIKIMKVDENTLSYELRVANTSDIIGAHLHYAPSGTNGPVVVFLYMAPPNGLYNGLLAEGTIDASNLVGPLAGMSIDDLVEKMEAGEIYTNVHTSAIPSGAIRGQVSMVEINDNRNYGTKLSGANEVPAAITDATGVAKFQFSKDGESASFQVNVDDIEDVRFAHIHLAKAGSNGGVVFTLRMDKVEGPVSGVYAKGEIMGSTLSGQMMGGDLEILREAFRTGNAYVNVHSDDFPGGELRGQIN